MARMGNLTDKKKRMGAATLVAPGLGRAESRGCFDEDIGLVSCIKSSQKKPVPSPPSCPRKHVLSEAEGRASSRGGFEPRPYKNLDSGSPPAFAGVARNDN